MKENKLYLYLVSIGNSLGLNLLGTYLDYYAIFLGSTPFIQSILVSSRNLGNNILQFLWGNLSDRRGRRFFLFSGFMIYGITTLIFILTRSPFMLIFIVIIQTVLGSMIIPAWNGLLGDLSTRNERGRFIGHILSVGTLSSVFGILLFGRISETFSSEGKQYYFIFSIVALSFLLASVFSLRIKNPNFLRREKRVLMKAIAIEDKRFRKFLVIYGIWMATMAFAWPLFPFVVSKIIHASKADISLLWATFMLTSYMGQRYGGSFSDKIGRKKSIFLFFFPMFSITLANALASTLWHVLIGNIIGGFFVGAAFVSVNSYILDCAGEENRASYTGFANLVIGTTSFFTSLISGSIADFLSVNIGLISTLRYMLFVITPLRITCVFLFLKIDETVPHPHKLQWSLFFRRP